MYPNTQLLSLLKCNPDYIRWTVQNIKFLIVEPSPLPFSSHLDPNIRLRILFSNTLSLLSSLNVRDHSSQSYSTTGNNIVLYILMFNKCSTCNISIKISPNVYLLIVYSRNRLRKISWDQRNCVVSEILLELGRKVTLKNSIIMWEVEYIEMCDKLEQEEMKINCLDIIIIYAFWNFEKTRLLVLRCGLPW